MFSDSLKQAMIEEIQVHNRKAGLTTTTGAVNWGALIAAVEASIPIFLSVFPSGGFNLAALPAAIGALVSIVVALVQGTPITPPVPAPAKG